MENKYIQGKIYRIDIGEDFYIGSTSKKLYNRKSTHIFALEHNNPMLLYVKMRELDLDFTMVNLTLVKNFPCHTIQELRREEGKFQRELKPTLNNNIAGRTDEEYKEDTKEQRRQYELKHKDKKNEYMRKYSQIPEVKEHRKKYMEMYYGHNQERLAERATEKIDCLYCGKKISRSNISIHHRRCPDRPSSSS